jgi:hypothetical protein
VTLSCPYWIKNKTGLPLSFCISSPNAGAVDSDFPVMPPVTSTITDGYKTSIANAESMMSKFFPEAQQTLRSYVPASLGKEQRNVKQELADTYKDTDSTMAGQLEFHRVEVERGKVTNGLIERPIVAEEGPVADYPALMFSFGPRQKRVLYAKIPGSLWSDNIPISDGGASGVVEIISEGMLFQLCLTTKRIVGANYRTNELVFRPRFVIVNTLEHTVQYRQKGTEASCVVRPQNRINFHWVDHESERELSIRLIQDTQAAASSPPGGGPAYQTVWSGGLDISALGETHVRLRPASPSGEAIIVRVEVKNHSETLYIILSPIGDSPGPYRIMNLTSHELLVRQQAREFDHERRGGCEDLLKPGTSLPYAWDEPLERHVLSVQVAGTDVQSSYELDAIKHHRSIGYGKVVLTVSVFADGPTKVFRVSEKDEEGRLVVVQGSAEAGVKQERHKRGRLRVMVRLSCLTVTLINSVPQELLLFSLENVSVQVSLAPKSPSTSHPFALSFVSYVAEWLFEC